MRSNYKRIGEFIRKVDNRNSKLKVTRLMGLSMTKEFREPTSNIVGTDLSVYKVVKKGQFACDFMSPIRVSKLPVALKMDDEPIIVSPAYPVFEVSDTSLLEPEYLMMWFRRSEFDRYATFKCDSAIRGGYDWNELCNTLIPVPTISKQREIVAEYNTIVNRIELNKKLIQKLEDTAQTIYKQWFIDFDFPDENGNPYKSNGGKILYSSNGEYPPKWEYTMISNLISVKDGTHDSPEPASNGFYLVTSTHLNHYDLDLTSAYKISAADYDQINKRSRVDRYDILFSMIGTVGSLCYILYDKINFAIKNVALFKTSERKEISTYILCFLKSDFMKNYLSSNQIGSTQNYVTLDILRNIPILFPETIVLQKFHNLIKPLFNKIHFTVKENRHLSSFANLLLSRLSSV